MSVDFVFDENESANILDEEILPDNSQFQNERQDNLINFVEGPKRWMKGDFVDVLDPKSEVYCPGEILEVFADERYLIKYLGWEDSWNEEISWKDVDRLLPAESYVFRCKAWVKLSTKLKSWPCVVYVRKPRLGSKIGENYLRDETRLCVVPCGDGPCLKPYKHGVWYEVKKISPFLINREKNIADGLENLESRAKETFVKAISELIDSDIKDYVFKFDGTLEVTEARPAVESKPRFGDTERSGSKPVSLPYRPVTTKSLAESYIAKVAADSRRRGSSGVFIGGLTMSEQSLKVILNNKRVLKEGVMHQVESQLQGVSPDISLGWHIIDHYSMTLTEHRRESLGPQSKRPRKQARPMKINIRQRTMRKT